MPNDISIAGVSAIDDGHATKESNSHIEQLIINNCESVCREHIARVLSRMVSKHLHIYFIGRKNCVLLILRQKVTFILLDVIGVLISFNISFLNDEAPLDHDNRNALKACE